LEFGMWGVGSGVLGLERVSWGLEFGSWRGCLGLRGVGFGQGLGYTGQLSQGAVRPRASE
jgi:hypothetical protein